MKVLVIPALVRATLAFAILLPLDSDAGLLDFLRGKKDPDTSQLGSQEIAAKAMVKNANEREAAGKYEAAREIHEDVVELYSLTSVAADSQFKIGELYEFEGEDSKAFDAYNDFIAKYKESPLYSKAVEKQFAIAERGHKGKTESFLGISYKMQPSRLIEMYTTVTKNAPYSKFAPLAQFKIGEIYGEQEKTAEAIKAYQQVVADYPDNKKAAEAQFEIGKLLTNVSKDGNNDQAHLRKTREAYEEFLIQFPSNELATVAKEQLTEIEAQEITKTFEIAQFYEKSGKLKAAAIYYQDVLKHPGAAEYEAAKARMDAIGEQGNLVIGKHDLTPEIVAVPADFDVKSRSDYLGPPAPKLASVSKRRSMRNSMDDLEPVPVVEPDLPEPSDAPMEAPSQGLLPPVSSSTPESGSQSPFETLLPSTSSPSSPLLGTPSSPILSTIEDFPTSPSPTTVDPAPESTGPIPTKPSDFNDQE